ncbi:aminoglycoside 6-adenylyltransferase [Fictibacillus sp. Sa2CUA10]|uniref:Aminoglycoside 6-adenylyltransferase n=2 Tax=Fictibacillus norfolkensis TaxID=2762233 RepID=A0ABR8SJA5_9BACL|nr:aminoglycoside 6-adenylyltransferase [Fictibacillus norfolkensis]
MRTIEQDLVADKNVIAVFYGGSIGKESTDLYSDIDLRVVVRDAVFEKFRENKKKRAANWGKVLFNEDFPWTNYSIAHYDSFIKVDTFYYKKKDLQPSIWMQHLKIVYDPEGHVNSIRQQSLQLSYLPSKEEVEIWRTKFFAYVHEFYRRIMRSELSYAKQCLENVIYSMVSGWYMNAGLQPNTFGDWSKVEGMRSTLAEWQRMLLSEWRYKSNEEDMLRVLKNILPEFQILHKELCEVVEITYDQNWEEDIFKKVLFNC